jgi:hypothetical protein
MDEMPMILHDSTTENANQQQQYHFQHQRTPGQILSLTSYIEFSPYLSYMNMTSLSATASPDLLAGRATAAAATKSQGNNNEDDEVECERRQQLLILRAAHSLAQNKSSGSSHLHDHTCGSGHVCKFRSRGIGGCTADKVPPHTISHYHHHHHATHHNHRQHMASVKRVNHESFVSNLNEKKNPHNVTNMSFSDSLSSSIKSIANNALSSSSSSCLHHHHHHHQPVHSHHHHNQRSKASSQKKMDVAEALCHRRLTPLRWSKKMSRRRGGGGNGKTVFKNFSALNRDSAMTTTTTSAASMLKPLLKGNTSITIYKIE